MIGVFSFPLGFLEGPTNRQFDVRAIDRANLDFGHETLALTDSTEEIETASGVRNPACRRPKGANQKGRSGADIGMPSRCRLEIHVVGKFSVQREQRQTVSDAHFGIRAKPEILHDLCHVLVHPNKELIGLRTGPGSDTETRLGGGGTGGEHKRKKEQETTEG